MVANHSIITGPNIAPTRAVPRFCTRNSATRMTTVSGTMNGLNASVATSSPSTADSTEMAGVMAPSP